MEMENEMRDGTRTVCQHCKKRTGPYRAEIRAVSSIEGYPCLNYYYIDLCIPCFQKIERILAEGVSKAC